jgi:4'-phosphopantetheinyl transferase
MLLIAVDRIHDETSTDDDVAPGWMGESEQRRWVGLSPSARREFLASRVLLRELLRAATGIPVDAWEVSAERGTAPLARARRRQVGMDAIHVSLSHRLGWVAAAVASAPVGVDVECERPMRTDPAERAALMLSHGEIAAWQALAPQEQQGALLTRWTAKEAWFKASPPELARWDFRRVAARASTRAGANVRGWATPALHVALCCADAQALAAAECGGLSSPAADESFWHVRRVAPAN